MELSNIINLFANSSNVAVFSSIAAFLSALYTTNTARSIKKSTQIAIDEFREKHETVHADLINGVYWETTDKTKILVFSCDINNKASAPNTISIELYVYEHEHYGQKPPLILKPFHLDEIPIESDLKPFFLPLNLDSKTKITGWISFRLPDNYKDKIIDRYEIVFLDSLGHRVSLNQYLIQRIENVKTHP